MHVLLLLVLLLYHILPVVVVKLEIPSVYESNVLPSPTCTRTPPVGQVWCRVSYIYLVSECMYQCVHVTASTAAAVVAGYVAHALILLPKGRVTSIRGHELQQYSPCTRRIQFETR